MKQIKRIISGILCAVLLISIPATEIYAGDTSQAEVMNGWYAVNGKKHYYQNGRKVTGFKVIEDGKYYFDKNGVMQTGLKTINGKKYYFDKNYGYMYMTSIYKNYIVDYKGVLHKIPKKTGNKKKDAKKVAKLIAKCIPKKGKERDIDRV